MCQPVDAMNLALKMVILLVIRMGNVIASVMSLETNVMNVSLDMMDFLIVVKFLGCDLLLVIA